MSDEELRKRIWRTGKKKREKRFHDLAVKEALSTITSDELAELELLSERSRWDR